MDRWIKHDFSAKLIPNDANMEDKNLRTHSQELNTTYES
jgi:hypothetical protein